ncbi:uncharacterized protein [Acropora muricata]|uniref:uncharacterized protein n=1 Tax=Acropora muricata TaxID=159855 RepID=UPI0034E5E1FB
MVILVSSANILGAAFRRQLGKSLTYIKKSKGSRMLPCGMPFLQEVCRYRFASLFNCHNCCRRWYFTFNGVECAAPAAIEGVVYMRNGESGKRGLLKINTANDTLVVRFQVRPPTFYQKYRDQQCAQQMGFCFEGLLVPLLR